MNHMVFFIEGNIGTGKSTILERMSGAGLKIHTFLKLIPKYQNKLPN